MPLNLLTGQMMNLPMPDFPQMQQNALAGQMDQLKLQEGMQELQAKNRLAQLMSQPGAVDPQTGAPAPQTLAAAMQIDPEAGMKLYEQRALAEDRMVQAEERKAKRVEKRRQFGLDMLKPVVMGYQEDLAAGLSDPTALDRAKDRAREAAEQAWKDGTLRDLGLTEEEYQQNLAHIQKWTPETMEQARLKIETDKGTLAQRREEGIQRRFEETMGLKREQAQGRERQMGGTLTPETVRERAEMWAAGDETGAFKGIPWGPMGKADRSAIMNLATQLNREKGVTGAGQVERAAVLGAQKLALGQQTKAREAIVNYASNIDQASDLLLELGKKVDNKGVPVFNRWINAGRRSLAGDPDVSDFDLQNKIVRDEFAKMILAGNTVGASGALADRQELDSAFSTANTYEQLQAVVNLIHRDTKIRMSSFDKNLSKLRGSIRGEPSGAAESGGIGEAQSARTSAASFRALSRDAQVKALATMSAGEKRALLRELQGQ